jgi:hypothetical protein
MAKGFVFHLQFFEGFGRLHAGYFATAARSRFAFAFAGLQ